MAYKKALAILLAAMMIISLSGCTYGLTPAQNTSQPAADASSVSSAALVDFNASSSEAVSSEVSSSEAASSEAASSEVSSKEEASSKAVSSKAASSKAASSKAASSKAASSKAASSKAASSKTPSAEVIASSAASSSKEPYIFLIYNTDSTGNCKITLKNAGTCEIISAALNGISDTTTGSTTLNYTIDKTVLSATATGAGVFTLQLEVEDKSSGTKYYLTTTVKAFQY